MLSAITYKTLLPIFNSALRSAINSSQSYGYTHTLSCNRTKPMLFIISRRRARTLRRRSGISNVTMRQRPSHFRFVLLNESLDCSNTSALRPLSVMRKQYESFLFTHTAYFLATNFPAAVRNLYRIGSPGRYLRRRRAFGAITAHATRPAVARVNRRARCRFCFLRLFRDSCSICAIHTIIALFLFCDDR